MKHRAKSRVIEKPVHPKSRHHEVAIILSSPVLRNYIAKGYVVDYRGESMTRMTNTPRITVNEKHEIVVSLFNPARLNRDDREIEQELPGRFK